MGFIYVLILIKLIAYTIYDMHLLTFAHELVFVIGDFVYYNLSCGHENNVLYDLLYTVLLLRH